MGKSDTCQRGGDDVICRHDVRTKNMNLFMLFLGRAERPPDADVMIWLDPGMYWLMVST